MTMRTRTGDGALARQVPAQRGAVFATATATAAVGAQGQGPAWTRLCVYERSDGC